MIRHALLALMAGFAVAIPLALHGQAAPPAPAPMPPAAAPAAPAPAAATPKNDYTDPATWLCRPGRQDACTVDLDATIVHPDGRLTVERFHADPHAPIDCFYVYPTVSRDPGATATMAIEPAEQNVVMQQFARFGAKCRLYAPMYRQFTLTALNAAMTGRPIPGGAAGRMVGYNDVVDAWNEYLANDNHGRGVVLIGHSQGSGVLAQLIAREIDGKPIQKQVISAILMGTSLQVPAGKDVGGNFQTIPLCHSAHQLHCVIAFADFRADSPPPDNSRFGKGRPAAGTLAACVNPSALAGGSGPLKAYLGARGALIPEASAGSTTWTNPPKPITTPFVEVPGMLTGQCISDAHGTYLAITVHPSASGKRASNIAGDVVIAGVVQKDWGLHLIDANLHMGKLVEIVGEEAKAYRAHGGR